MERRRRTLSLSGAGLRWGVNVFNGDPLFVLEVEASHLISIIQDVCLCVL